ncbi:MAG: ATP-dependent Clp protease ATP-binding subunit, partial [Acidobacteria bacterium]|nr:ATP-dependent Clp protease ATP-binding subunit [Acidobacteriota bacterium]
FRLVKLDEPTIEDTRTILQGLKPRLEKNYGVEISSKAMDVALGLAPRYLRAHRLPDKVIGWLDTAAVKVEIKSAQQHGAGAVVTGDDIIRVISQEAKIPVDVILRETGDRLRNMEEALARRVIGQKHAIEALSRRIRLNKGPLKENFLRPDGVFLFLGPTGVGKTELAKALAEFLFGDERKMIRLDMSEYQDDMVAVEKLIGMPRGIVGSERGGILTSALQENPYTVLLLDEVEKASPYLLNLFLQAFDEGWLTDGRGRKAYLSDAVVIMTSNLGGDHFRRLTESVGFAPKGGNGDEELVSFKSVRREVIKEVERRFSPEFRNRIDEYLVFAPLTADEVLQITELNVKLLVGQMERLGKRLKVTPAAIGHLSRIGFSLQYGARFLKRTIEEKVKIPITLHWNEDVSWVADVENDDIVVKRGTDY